MGEHQIIGRQRGLITRTQALAAGMSPTTISRRLAQREWFPVYPGVYRHAGAEVCDRLMLEAAILWLGPSAVVSGSWAAWWHEWCRQPIGPVSITVPRSAAYRCHRYLDLRRRDLDRADVVILRGVKVTGPALTALENASLAGGSDVFDRALQRHTPLDELHRSLERMSGAHGAATARRTLAERSDGAVSPPERELGRAMRRAGITGIRAGVGVDIDGCRYLLDFASAQLKLAIEVDGVAPHTAPEVFHRDRERQNALVMDGWTVLRFTPWQIRHQLPRVLAEISSTLNRLRSESAR